jgi:hypothetical protein
METVEEGKKLTAADVAASLPVWKLAEDPWPVSHIYRPLSIRLCPLIHGLGFSPSGITVLGLALTLLLPLSLLGPYGEPPGWGVISAALLLALGMAVIEVLDCVDGDLARATGRSSAAGACIDSVADVFFRALAVSVLGALIARSFPDALWGQGQHGVSLGLGAASCILLAKLIGNRVELAIEQPPGGDSPEAQHGPQHGFGLMKFLSGLYAAIPMMLPIATALDALPAFFAAWAVYAAGDVVLTIVESARKLA